MSNPEQKAIEVIATSRGYYGGMVREAGDRFMVTGKVGSWMAAVVKSAPAPEQEPKPAPKTPAPEPKASKDDI